MKLILCFGVVCQLMTILRNTDKKHLLQGNLVSRYVSCIDPYNIILRAYKGNREKKYLYNSPNLSRIMRGETLFELDNNLQIENIDITAAATSFKTNMAYCISGEYMPLLMLTLLDIIKKDEYINGDGKTSFEKYIDRNSESYYFPDFMIRILLYTADNLIDPSEEKKLVRTISDSMINGKKKGSKYSIDNDNILTEYIRNVQEDYLDDTYDWDPKKQLFTIKNKEKFGISESVRPNLELGGKSQNIINMRDDDDVFQSEEYKEFMSGLDKEPIVDTSEGFIHSTEEGIIPSEYASFIFDKIVGDDIKMSYKYKKCCFCKYFKPLDEYSSKRGDCTLHEVQVGMDDSICQHFKKRFFI